MGEKESNISFANRFIVSLFCITSITISFFSNEPLNKKGRLYWGAAILIAYIIAILGFAVLFNNDLNIPYIGNKLALYQKAQEKGMADTSINIFSPLNLFSLLLYYYMMYFYDTLRKENVYFTIMMKVLTFGIVFHVLFSFSQY